MKSVEQSLCNRIEIDRDINATIVLWCCRDIPTGGQAMLWQVGTVEAALNNLKSEMAAAGLSPDARLAVTAKRSRADHLVRTMPYSTNYASRCL